ncbi:MAG: hypothetical protein H6698_05305 [Myxococcales bacterium]|nr:hypothetical protein [Myxococcales bacterium]MCB9530206.1 hypothetical protein [Myxococcales bacterium]MCB9533719.1 hypothetical protein [Myxococcales bacterium]
MSDAVTLATPALDRTVLPEWLESFERVIGQPVEVREFGDDGHQQLVFPASIDENNMLGGTGHFGQSPAMVAHNRSLGFEWTEQGRILTAPTPGSLNELLDARVGADVGWRLGYVREARGAMSMGPFLRRYLDGTIPIQLGGAEFVREQIARRGPGALRFQFISVAHDLTVHGLNYHLVDRDLIEQLRARVFESVPERAESWASPGASGPLTLGFFLDNDLNRYCYAVWCRASGPAEFRRLFRANFGQLLAGLDIRLRETRDGKGDVPSGDTNDMAPLDTVEFRIP